MLTAKDLALIRAALLFFQEENCTVDRLIIKHYFGRDSCRGITAETVRNLRAALQTCRISYGLVDRHQSELVSQKLFRTASRARQSAQQKSTRVAPMLLFGK